MKEQPKTDVIFRRWKIGNHTIIALMPYHAIVFAWIPDMELCESHQGETHTEADYNQILKLTTAVKLDEPDVQDVMNDLAIIGYKKLHVISRRNTRKYQAAVKAARPTV